MYRENKRLILSVGHAAGTYPPEVGKLYGGRLK